MRKADIKHYSCRIKQVYNVKGVAEKGGGG